jgi:hypothetical protein
MTRVAAVDFVTSGFNAQQFYAGENVPDSVVEKLRKGFAEDVLVAIPSKPTATATATKGSN